MPIKTIFIAVILLIAVALGFWEMNRSPQQVAGRTAPKNAHEEVKRDVVPNPSFTSMDHKTYALHDFKGKTIVLNFWATWCVPCVAEFPALLALAEREKERVVLIALSVDEQPENIAFFIKQYEPEVRRKTQRENVIIAHDLGKKISQDLFQVVKYPETFIIGPDLTVQKKISGFTDWSNIQLY